MKTIQRLSILILILIVAALLRFSGLDWDQGTHLHPDERYLTFLTSLLKWPGSLAQFFDSGTSPLNPYNTDWGRSYVYGTLPLFIVRGIAEWLNALCKTDTRWLPEQLLQFWLGAASPGCNISPSSGIFTSYDVVVLVGRTWSAFCDTLGVLVLFLASRRMFGWRTGLVAAALSALAVLPIQQAHFFTVDSTANLFVILCLAGCVGLIASTRARFSSARIWGYALFAGLMAGCAIASKISTWPLVAMLILSIAIALIRDPHRSLTALLIAIVATGLAGVATFAAFRVGQPYSFIGNSERELMLTLERCVGLASQGNADTLTKLCAIASDLPTPLQVLFAPTGRWIEQLILAQGFVNGTVDAPFGIQWANRTPLAFPLVNLVFWGLGIALGLTACLGFIFAARRLLRGRRWWVYLPLGLWVGGYFVYQGAQWTKAMRYQLPIYPFLCLCAALLLVQIRHRLALAPISTSGQRRGGVGRFVLRWLPSALVLLITLVWAVGFTTIYRQPYTRVQASKWIYDNAPAGAVIATEHWDDAIPVTLDTATMIRAGFINASTITGTLPARRSPSDYGKLTPIPSNPDSQIHMYDEDTPEKYQHVLSWLDEADYIVLTSNRLYASIPRLPQRYPLAIEYYRALFNGELGFELAADFHQFTQIGPLAFNDQEMPQPLRRFASTQGSVPWVQVPYPTAEEAFSVYDHPRVLIFKKTANYSRTLAETVLGKVDVKRSFVQAPVEAVNAPNGLVMTDQMRQTQQSGGTWASLFPADSPLNQSQTLAVIAWLVLIEILGIAAWPMLALVSGTSLVDRGYSFAKILGLLLLALIVWWLGSTKIATFSRTLIGMMVAMLLLASAWLWWRNGARLLAQFRSAVPYLIVSEVLFAAAIALFLNIRIANPDLWHPYMGGEKPMDFAYFNAVLKSSYFPPYDPWYAGGYLNYYYFGWVIFGAPVKLLGIDPTVAYNIIIPTIYGLVVSGAFGLAASFINTLDAQAHLEQVSGDILEQTSPTMPVKLERTPFKKSAPGYLRSVVAGCMAALFVVGIGNIEQINVLARALQRLGDADSSGSLPALLQGISRWQDGTPLPMHLLQLYWDATRLFENPGVFAEFPFFTFLYADLHAHMMAMPLVLLVLAFALMFASGAISTSSVILAGLAAGALWSSNTWDYPTMLGLCMAGLTFGMWQQRHSNRPKPQHRAVTALHLLLAMGGLIAVSRAAYIPYLENYGAAYNSVITWDGETTPLSVYLKIYFVFMAPVLFGLIPDIARTLQGTLPVYPRSRQGINRPSRLPTPEQQLAQYRATVAVCIVIVAFMLAGGLAFFGVPAALGALPLFVIAGLAVFVSQRPAQARLLWLMVAGAFALTLFVEIFTLKGDIGRMNTVFKFYVQAWILLGIAAAVCLVWSLWRLRWGWRVVLAGMMSLLLPLALLYPATAVPAKMRDRYTNKTPEGLDGDEYMRYAIYSEKVYERDVEFALQSDYEAIEWLRRNVVGSPVIMEGTTGGALYRWGNRMSIYTGLPAVLGWQWHQRQQRAVLPEQRIYERDNDVAEFYNTTDLGTALKILRRYQVRYIIVGDLERAYYDKAGFDKFNQLVNSGFLRVMFQNAGTTIYEL